ncbi:MAG: permease [Patescibacteria group bacterium]
MEKVVHYMRWQWIVASAILIAVLTDLRIMSSGQFFSIELPNKLQDLLTLTFSIIIESMPFVLLGIFLAVIIRIWVPAKALQSWLPKYGILRRLYISLMGVLLPVCECGNLPLARGLIARGFTPAESLTFLLAAPILNPITLITTHQAFGGDIHILLARAFGALLIANLIGWLFSKHRRPEKMLTQQFLATCKSEGTHSHTRPDRSLTLFGKELGNLLPALFVGALVAGLIQVLVPREVLVGLGSNPALSILIMMLLAFIVSICSNVDAFFALAFSNTFSVGSIVSFLVFGPMIDIKMLNLMRTTYTVPVLIQVTAVVALMSAAIGLAVNYAL